MTYDGSLNSVFTGALWALFGIATLTDLARGKIYNWLTFSFFLAGAGARLFLEGGGGAQSILSSFLLSLALYFPLWRLQVLAAGDVKLLMAASPWLPAPELARLAILSIVIGALVGLVVRLEKAWRLRRNPSPTPASRKFMRMPYAPAFLVAFILMQIAQLEASPGAEVAKRFLGSVTPW